MKHIYVSVCMYTHIHMYVRIYIPMYLHTYIHVWKLPGHVPLLSIEGVTASPDFTMAWWC